MRPCVVRVTIGLGVGTGVGVGVGVGVELGPAQPTTMAANNVKVIAIMKSFSRVISYSSFRRIRIWLHTLGLEFSPHLRDSQYTKKELFYPYIT